MAKKAIIIGATALKMRKQIGVNQTQFWAPLGVTQSAGCRYENGRTIPKPIRMLIAIAHGGATTEQLLSGALAKKA